MLGQIATFMETLHLTYNEVLHEIPYRNLVIMAKDKQRAVYDSDVMVEVDEAEYFKNRPNPIKS